MTLEIDFKIENLKTHPPDIHSQDQLSNPIISSSPGPGFPEKSTFLKFQVRKSI